MSRPKENKFVGFRPKCVMCGKEIPATVAKPKTALTCSDECKELRKDYRRSKEDEVRCRYCYKPSTPAQRRRFRRFVKWELLNPPPDDQLDPEEIAEREYRKANPPKKTGPKVKTDVETVSSDVE